MKKHLGLMFACLALVVSSNFSTAHPLIMHQAGTASDVKILGNGPSRTLRVGRPTLELHQYLINRGYDLPDRENCFLVLSSAGTVEQDIAYVAPAADTYFLSDALANSYLSPYTAVDINQLIQQIQGDIFNADAWLALVQWTEALEVGRNGVFKIIFSIKTGDPELAYSFYAKEVLSALAGYVTDHIVDQFFFDKKAQRRLAARYKELYVQSAKRRLDIVETIRDGRPLLCDATDRTPQDLYAAITAIQDGARTEYQNWSGKAFNAIDLSDPVGGIVGNLIGQGEDVVNSLVSSYIGKLVGGLGNSKVEKVVSIIASKVYHHATPFQANLNPPPLAMGIPIKLRHRGLEQLQVGSRFVAQAQNGIFTTDAIFLMLWEAYDDGIFDSPVFEKYDFNRFVEALVESRAEGELLHRIFTITEQSLAFQDAVLQEFYSPARISDVNLSIEDYTRVSLTWTVPSDDMGTANVESHVIAYSDRPITNELQWMAAMGHWLYNGGSAGTIKTVTTPELPNGREFFFAVRGIDQDGNNGPVSNSPKITIGQGVNPIALLLPDFVVDPHPGSNFAEAHTYFIRYSHAGGSEPKEATIILDGIPHAMTRIGGNFKDGILYRFRDTTAYQAGSTHTYFFEFSTENHDRRLPASGSFELNVDPVLYRESVSPEYSETHELRTFRVAYRHPNGKWPVRSDLRLHRTQPIPMKLISGAPLNGAVYEARAYINRQNAEYYFDFSDGSSTFRHPTMGTLTAGVGSLTDVAIVGMDLPDAVECGDVIPIRPAIRNAGTEFLTDVVVRFKINSVQQGMTTIDIIAPGITRSGAVAFEWNVPQSNIAQQYTVTVSVESQPGESALANNTVEQLYDVPAGRGKLRGVVYDASGVVPVEGALVQAVGESNIVASASTDQTGVFLLDGVRAGSYVVIASDSGTKKQVVGLQVNAGQETAVGAVTLDAQGVVQHTHYTGQSSLAFKALQTSLHDGMIGYYRATSPRGIYLMPRTWSGWNNVFGAWSFNIGYNQFSMSPTRRELVFYATREDVSPYKQGIFRIDFNSSGSPVALTHILDRDIAGFQPINPVYISDTTILFYRSIDGNNTLWAIERDGTNVREMFANVPFDYRYTMNSNGTLAVANKAVYALDYAARTVSLHKQLPTDYIGPRLTHDSSRVLFVKLLDRRQLCSAPLAQPDNYTQHTYGFVNSRGYPAPGWRDERVYYADDSTQSAHANVMSMPFVVPTAYAYALNSNCGTHNPLILDGMTTNHAVLNFTLNKNALVTARILDSQRRLAAVLNQAEEMAEGPQTVSWNGTHNNGISVDLGVYYLTLDVQDPEGDADNVFHYEQVWPVQYGSVAITNNAQWLAYSADGSMLYVSDTGGQMRRYTMDDGSYETLPVTNVFSFSVNSLGMMVAHKAPDTGYPDYVFYNHDGSGRQFYIQGDTDMYLSPHKAFPGLHPTKKEFVYPAFVPNRNKIMRCTAPGTTSSILASDTMRSVGPRYSQDGNKLILSMTAGNESIANIYEMNATGSGLQQQTIHPKGEMLPRYIPGSSRILFYANWAGWAHQIWTADKTGSNPWWLLPYQASYEYNMDLSPHANSIAMINNGQLRIIELPQHLNKGAVQGRVVDGVYGVGLPAVPVRAIQAGQIVAGTRSNSHGYFKLLNIRAGQCSVIAGGGDYLETEIAGVVVEVAKTRDVGDVVMLLNPSASLLQPVPGAMVPGMFSVQAAPSERCARAEFQWRASTNDPWTVGSILTEGNDFTASFSAVDSGWSDGVYYVRSVGYDASDVPESSPVSGNVTYRTAGPALELTVSSVTAEHTGFSRGGIASIDDGLIDFTTIFASDDKMLNTTIFDVRYPGETDWMPFASHSSPNTSGKCFDAAFLPSGMDVEFRVRSYDHSGNIQTSNVLVIRKEVPGDSDGDGIPDWWELLHNLNPYDHSDGEDFWEGGNITNLAKFLAGSSGRVWVGTGEGETIDELNFGEIEGAKDGYDSFDQLLTSGASQRSRFLQNGVELTNDFRPITSLARWRLLVDSDTRDRLTLSWNTVEICQGRALYLQEVCNERPVGLPVDMKSVDRLSDVKAGTVFEIVYGIPQDYQVELQRGWNLVGNPVMTPASFGDLVLQGRNESAILWPCWLWDGAGFARVATGDAFCPEIGYMVLCGADSTSIQVVGLPTDGTVLLKPGWNMVSPVASGRLAIETRSQVSAWRYDTSRRFMYSVLADGVFVRGKAYWLHLDGDQTFRLTNF